MEPTQAWEQSKDDIDENAKYGTWKGDYFLSKPDESGRYCHPLEIRLVFLDHLGPPGVHCMSEDANIVLCLQTFQVLELA